MAPWSRLRLAAGLAPGARRRKEREHSLVRLCGGRASPAQKRLPLFFWMPVAGGSRFAGSRSMLDGSRLDPAPRRRVWRCGESRGHVQADVEALFPGVISLMYACVWGRRKVDF